MKTLNKKRKVKYRLENGKDGVKAETEKKLDFLKKIGVILWYERLNSGKPVNYVKPCRPGTFDFLIFMDDVIAVFLETKKEGAKVDFNSLRYEQREFVKQFTGLKKVVCAVINHESKVADLISIIKSEIKKPKKNSMGELAIVNMEMKEVVEYAKKNSNIPNGVDPHIT